MGTAILSFSIPLLIREEEIIELLHSVIKMGELIIQIFVRFFFAYFSQICTYSHPLGIDSCLQIIHARVSAEQNLFLTADFTEQDIKKALFSMNPLRAPGPDDFPAWFYHKHWSTIGKEVSDFAKSLTRIYLSLVLITLTSHSSLKLNLLNLWGILGQSVCTMSFIK